MLIMLTRKTQSRSVTRDGSSRSHQACGGGAGNGELGEGSQQPPGECGHCSMGHHREASGPGGPQ